MAGLGPRRGGNLELLAGVNVLGHTRGRADLVRVADGAVRGLLHRAGEDPEVVFLKNNAKTQ